MTPASLIFPLLTFAIVHSAMPASDFLDHPVSPASSARAQSSGKIDAIGELNGQATEQARYEEHVPVSSFKIDCEACIETGDGDCRGWTDST